MAPIAVAVLGLVAGASHAAAQGRCVPVADIVGDSSLAGEVTATLEARGIRVAAASACGVIQVELTSEGESIRVALTDPQGRFTERQVRDLQAASTVVESWVRRDLFDPLLAARALPAVRARNTAERPVVANGPAPAGSRDVTLGVAADVGMGSDGSRWTGARVFGCIEMGPTCVGAMVRFAIDTTGGGSSQVFDTRRSALDTLLTVELPVRRDRVLFAPGLGFGLSSVRVSRSMGADKNEDDTGGVRLQAHAALDYKLLDTWYLHVDSAVGYAPSARTILNDAGQMAETEADAALAGEPDAQFWVGLGLRYGRR